MLGDLKIRTRLLLLLSALLALVAFVGVAGMYASKRYFGLRQ